MTTSSSAGPIIGELPDTREPVRRECRCATPCPASAPSPRSLRDVADARIFHARVFAGAERAHAATAPRPPGELSMQRLHDLRRARRRGARRIPPRRACGAVAASAPWPSPSATSIADRASPSAIRQVSPHSFRPPARRRLRRIPGSPALADAAHRRLAARLSRPPPCPGRRRRRCRTAPTAAIRRRARCPAYRPVE